MKMLKLTKDHLQNYLQRLTAGIFQRVLKQNKRKVNQWVFKPDQFKKSDRVFK